MWRWRFLKFPPLLKCARGGNLDRLSHVLDEGEQDVLGEKDKDENIHELVHPHNQEMVVLDWKAHVYAWSLYVDGLYYLCESHSVFKITCGDQLEMCSSFALPLRLGYFERFPVSDSLLQFLF